MPDFSYTARTKDGVVENDIIAASNPRAAAEAIRAKGLIPSSIKPVSKGFDFALIMDTISRIKLLDKITFIKNLGVMVKSGLPVSKSLRIISEQTDNKKMSKIISDIYRQVEA